MPQLEYFLVCQSMQIDVMSNEISLVNVLEDIVPEKFPHLVPRAVAVSLWNFDEGDQEDYQAVLVVKVPGKKDARFAMNFTTESHRRRAVQAVLEIPVFAPCDVLFEVQLNGEHAASHIVRVHPPEVRFAGGAEDRENNPDSTE